MKSILTAVVLIVSGAAFAQEIGTEITPTTPSSGVNQQNTNTQQNSNPPPQNNEQKGGYVYKPKGSKEEAAAAATFTGTKVSAASGDFGLRASFGASGSVGLPDRASPTVAAPSIGIAYFASDSFKLLIDLGFGLGISNSFAFSAGLGVGFDYLFRTPGDALRPFFHLAANFGIAGGSSSVDVTFGAQLGFGAEYFFSPSFSVNGRLLLVAPMALPGGNFVLGIFSLTPGVGATWYF